MAASALELRAGDGATLRGVRWSGGATWLVLVHEHGGDLDCWWPLQPLLEARGLSALALDRRGHGGSEGAAGEDDADDVRAAVRFARTEGAACVLVVAAGDAALLALAAVDADAPDGYVLLSPPAAERDALRGLRGAGRAKLILAGGFDAQADAAARAVQRVSIGWSLVVSLPTSAQGAALLGAEGGVADHVGEQLGRFVAETSWQRTTSADRVAG